jgi:hypothetical protein
LSQVTAHCGRRDLELAGQLLDTNHMVYPQDLAEPLETFWGEFSWLTGFHFVYVVAVDVMLIPLCGRSISVVVPGQTQCSILIDYMTNLLEINQILSRRPTGGADIAFHVCATRERKKNSPAEALLSIECDYRAFCHRQLGRKRKGADGFRNGGRGPDYFY